MHDQAAALRRIGRQRRELLGPAKGRLIHDLAAGEAGRFQGIHHPCAGRKAAMMPGELGGILVAGEQRDQGNALVAGRQERVRFQDELAGGDAPDLLQASRGWRMW